MAVTPKEPFSLWVMLREPGGPDREEFTACPGAAAFGSSSVAKLFQEGFFPKDLPCKPPPPPAFPWEEAPGADCAPCVPSRL